MNLPFPAGGRTELPRDRASPHRPTTMNVLKLVLGFDAVTCVVLGAALAAATGPAARLTGLPFPLLLEAGWFLIAFGAFVAWAAWKRSRSTAVVGTIVAANVAWAVASVVHGVVGGGDATTAGTVFVIGQGVATGVLALVEFIALRRSMR